MDIKIKTALIDIDQCIDEIFIRLVLHPFQS